MGAINLLWLIVPAIGLAAYVQYACSYYESGIEKAKNRINEIKGKMSAKVLGELVKASSFSPDQKELLAAVGKERGWGALALSDEIIKFVFYVVTAQAILVLPSIFDSLGSVVVTVTVIVFYARFCYLFKKATDHIAAQKGRHEKIRDLEEKMGEFEETQKRFYEVCGPDQKAARDAKGRPD